jgi:hypothetical protein
MIGTGRRCTGNCCTLFDRLVAYPFPANAKILGSVNPPNHPLIHTLITYAVLAARIISCTNGEMGVKQSIFLNRGEDTTYC